MTQNKHFNDTDRVRDAEPEGDGESPLFPGLPPDRRKNALLREAVDQLRANLFEVHQAAEIYQRVLACSAGFTDSQFGLVLERDETVDRSRFLISAVHYPETGDNGWVDEQGPVFFDVVEEVFRTRIPKLPSVDDRVEINRAFPRLPLIKHLIAIPLLDANRVHAVILLANAPNPFYIGLARQLNPLFSVAVCMLRLINGNKPLTREGIASERVENDWQDVLAALEKDCPIGIVRLDDKLNIVRINSEAEKIFGIEARRARGLGVGELVPERFTNEHRTQLFVTALMQSGPTNKLQTQGRNFASGAVINLNISTVSISIQQERFYLLFVNDITEVGQIRAEMEEYAQRFKAVSDLAPIGIMHANDGWEAVYFNGSWCDICDLPGQDMLGLGWMSILFGENAEEVIRDMHDTLQNGETFSHLCHFANSKGDLVWAEFLARPMFERNGGASGFIATLTDRTYWHMTETRLREIAESDALTGLANRLRLADRLEHALERVERHSSLALLCLDLDGFKNVNDTLGHDIGDKLLIEISHRLLNCVRKEDTVARVGGDEFLILIEDLGDASVVADIANKILETLRRPTILQSQEVFISTSIGIAFATRGSRVDAQSLIKQADIAMYRAKNSGRNNYQYYSPDLEEESRDRLELGNSLHKALIHGEFRLHYQAQSDVQSGAITGIEALLRWQHPERGLLQPDVFIELLEETGIIVSVTRWVMGQALRDLAALRQQGKISPDCTVSLNFSPRVLRDNFIVENLKKCLAETGTSGESLIVEITESSLLEDSPAIHKVLDAIKGMNVRISLDDFGTGFSSLTYIKRFPIDEIKIDRSFIRDLATDSEDQSIAQAVLALARSLKLSSVAEGVESPECLTLLKDWQCTSFQGYCLNRPLPLADLKNFLEGYQGLQQITL